MNRWEGGGECQVNDILLENWEQSEQRTVPCTLYEVQYAVYVVQYTVCVVQYTVYGVKCTVYSVRCTVYSV